MHRSTMQRWRAAFGTAMAATAGGILRPVFDRRLKVPQPIVRVYIAVSLDGCIAREDGALDWLEPMQVAGEDYGYAQFFADIDALIIGRNTYDSVLAFPQWPFGGKPVTVLTHRAPTPQHGELAYAGALRPLLERLAAAGLRAVYLDGGQAIRQGLQEHLVDELTLKHRPGVAGAWPTAVRARGSGLELDLAELAQFFQRPRAKPLSPQLTLASARESRPRRRMRRMVPVRARTGRHRPPAGLTPITLAACRAKQPRAD